MFMQSTINKRQPNETSYSTRKHALLPVAWHACTCCCTVYAYECTHETSSMCMHVYAHTYACMWMCMYMHTHSLTHRGYLPCLFTSPPHHPVQLTQFHPSPSDISCSNYSHIKALAVNDNE